MKDWVVPKSMQKIHKQVMLMKDVSEDQKCSVMENAIDNEVANFSAWKAKEIDDKKLPGDMSINHSVSDEKKGREVVLSLIHI